MIRVKEAIVVEGRYDKNTLLQTVEATGSALLGYDYQVDGQVDYEEACAMVDAFLNNSFVKGAAPERAAFLTSLFDGVLKVEAENFK